MQCPPLLSVTAQRILSPMKAPLPSLTKRYEPVYKGLAVVKVSLGLVTYQHVPSPSCPIFKPAHALHRSAASGHTLAATRRY